MSHTVSYPNIRSRVRLGRAGRAAADRFDYAEYGLERFRPHPKARDSWARLLWIDFDGIGKAKRTSDWKAHKARKQWEHNVVTREAHRRSRARKAARRGEFIGE